MAESSYLFVAIKHAILSLMLILHDLGIFLLPRRFRVDEDFIYMLADGGDLVLTELKTKPNPISFRKHFETWVVLKRKQEDFPKPPSLNCLLLLSRGYFWCF